MKRLLPFPLNFDSYEGNPLPLVHTIKLSKKHFPIHPKVLLNTQEEYENYIEMMLYLKNQVELGFQPFCMVTYHLKHPREYLKPLKETNNQFGHKDTYGYRFSSNLWNQVRYDNYMHNRRNDYDLVVKENNFVKQFNDNEIKKLSDNLNKKVISGKLENLLDLSKYFNLL